MSAIKDKALVRTTIDKLRMGDHITDKELDETIKVLTTLLHCLEAVGQRRHDLVTQDVRQDLLTLLGYQRARSER